MTVTVPDTVESGRVVTRPLKANVKIVGFKMQTTGGKQNWELNLICNIL